MAQQKHPKRKLAIVKTDPLARVPEDSSPFLVLMGLLARDGSGEIAFCSSEKESPRAILLDTSRGWDPDGYGNTAVTCPTCEKPHWTISLVEFLAEVDYSIDEGDVVIDLKFFLAQTIVNLRTSAARSPKATEVNG